MYKLTKLDKFNISNLISLRWDWLTDDEFKEWYDLFLSMDNQTLWYNINNILYAWEQDWNHSKTSKEQELFDYCNKLVEKLIKNSWDKKDDNKFPTPTKTGNMIR